MANTKKVTDRNTGRTSTKPKRVFEKVVTYRLVGGSKSDLQKVAHSMHKTLSDETAGGCQKRKVTVTHDSTEPKQIFYGKI